MTSGVLNNFLLQGPNLNLACIPVLFPNSSSREDEAEKLEGGEDEGEREEEDEDEDEECEAQEDEEESFDPFLSSHGALDVTNQLLRFADLISRDIQRYFGCCSDDRESCDIYSGSVSTTTSGRLRYYDDLLRIARAGSPEEHEDRAGAHADEPGAAVAKDNGGLGPLAELFNHSGPSQGRGQPMVKRHLPLSFWTEPVPRCNLDSPNDTPSTTHSNTHAQEHTHHNPLGCTEPDFSDLLAYWDPHLEFTHTLMEDTHTLMVDTHTLMEDTHTLMEDTHTLMEDTHTLMVDTHTLMEDTHMQH